MSVKGHGRVDSTGREMRGGGGATTKLIIKSHLILQHEPETPRVQTPSNSPQSPCMPRGDTLTVNRIYNRRHKRKQMFLYTLKCLHLRRKFGPRKFCKRKAFLQFKTTTKLSSCTCEIGDMKRCWMVADLTWSSPVVCDEAW